MPVLGKKTLKEIRAWLALSPASAAWMNQIHALGPRWASEIDRAIKPRRSVRAANKRRRAKRAIHTENIRVLRAKVFARTDGQCEAILTSLERCHCRATDLDHFWGRRYVLVDECWALCRTHHEFKTNNKPSRAEWLAIYKVHCDKHGYKIASERAWLSRLNEKAKGILRAEASSVYG